MKIASWNVNSLNVRLGHVEHWLRSAEPDVLGLQELKMVTEKFPLTSFEALGYHAVANGQKTYNGVALISREPPEDVVLALPDFEDEQKRVVAATFGDTRIINLYVPNGHSVGSEKYAYKLGWLDALIAWLTDELARHERLAVMGDFNIAPEDRDVHDPEQWRDKILCSKPERERLAALTEAGLVDSFRLFDQPETSFSWWDYRAAGFRRNLGLRIDLILVSQALSKACTASGIDVEPRRLERPSDHTPVWSSFS
jgi:exodeoxyribonuclease-3